MKGGVYKITIRGRKSRKLWVQLPPTTQYQRPYAGIEDYDLKERVSYP